MIIHAYEENQPNHIISTREKWGKKNLGFFGNIGCSISGKFRCWKWLGVAKFVKCQKCSLGWTKRSWVFVVMDLAVTDSHESNFCFILFLASFARGSLRGREMRCRSDFLSVAHVCSHGHLPARGHLLARPQETHTRSQLSMVHWATGPALP